MGMADPLWKRNEGSRWEQVPTSNLADMVEYRLKNAQSIAASVTEAAKKSRAETEKLDAREREANEALVYWTKRAEMVCLLEEELKEREIIEELEQDSEVLDGEE